MFNNELYIHIDDIELNDLTYRISTDNNYTKLLNSIKINGLISPCLLRKLNNRFVVISGYRRIMALKEIGVNKVLSKIIQDDNEPEEDINLLCAKISIIENAFSRELNLIEQAKATALLRNFLSIQEISINSPYVFNVNLNVKIVEKLLELYELDDTVHELIFNKKLSMNNALRINHYDSKVFDAYIGLFQKVRMGQNKQTKTITWLNEISLRENISLIELLKSNEIIEILEQNNPDENFKGNLIGSYLIKRRYPEMTRAYDQHKKYVKKLKLKPNIKLTPPIYFEGEKYSLSFEFKDKKEFGEHIQKLISISKDKDFANLII